MSDKTTSSSAEWAPCPFCGSVPYPEGDGFEHHQTDNCVLDSLWMRADELTEWNTRVQRTALAASQPADPVTNAGCRQTVKVKPLVWTYVGGETWIARTTIGIASVQKDTHGWGVWLAGQNSESVCWRVENTIETAKAAAQADYEGRILAALEAAHTEIAPMDKIDTSTALLPCPFCGGEAILMTPAGSRPYIMCAERFCGGPQNSTEVAIAAWNRRAIGEDKA